MMILTTFEAIGFILLAGLMGIICGLSSYFLDYCFWPGSIFKNYLPWLAMCILKKRDQKVYDQLVAQRAYGGIHAKWQEQAVDQAQNYWQFKILGGCAVCFNIWIAILSWTVICLFSFLPWYYGFAYVTVSSWLIRKLMKAD
jgi:hypothetical protein